MEELLRYQSVEVSFNGRAVTHDVTFSLHPGEILGIVGESGSGKSTLLKAALGLLGRDGLVTRGDIWFEGKDLPDLSEGELRQIRGARIGMIFQNAGPPCAPSAPSAIRSTKVWRPTGKFPVPRLGRRLWPCLNSWALMIPSASGRAIPLNCPGGRSSAWALQPPCS